MAQFPFGVGAFYGGPPEAVDADGCWIGLPSAFELKLQRPLPTYALEQLRLRMMFALTDNHDITKSARVMLQTACETELRAVLFKVTTLAGDVMSTKVCQRRKFVDVDADLHQHRYLVAPALTELRDNPSIPVAYTAFIERYVESSYPKYRVSALSTVVCLAAAVAS